MVQRTQTLRMMVPEGDGNQLTPSLSKVEDAIQQVKNKKTAAKDDITVELIGTQRSWLPACIEFVIVRIWENE